ncbi:MAG: zinc ribbon domain-containing protein [Chitinispirillaceae bacterium]|nr:zinc ribbon domain-containing protein [Chitinispirillaceae bacterium]
MPTYEYKCEKCGKTFERFQSMTDAPLSACPSCGGNVKRLIGTGGGFILKGSGFHANDYPSGAGNAPANTRCGREKPCCGRDTFCGSPKCES